MSAAASLASRAAFRAPSTSSKNGKHKTSTSSAAARRRVTPRASIAEPPPGGGGSDAATEGAEVARAKVSMVSLGCPKNTVDGEVMLGDLFANGFDIVDDHDESDAIIINTCGFVEVGGGCCVDG